LVDVSDAPNVLLAPLNIGRYQVTDRLGQGGMGIVYLARDPSLERFVAIKLMRAGFDTPDLRERFVREARAVASLRHPCIVTLFEYGDHEGQPFIVMEYVNGKTLGALIGAGTPMSLARRLQLIEDMCRGLEHAHKAGIIHRDVKPANIMVDAEGTLKILDFGIAKLGHAGHTQISALVGTPKYMSPEQIAGKAVTRRSDIFSVGLVVYEMLACRPAYDVGNTYVVMDAILHRDPIPLAQCVPDLDPRIIRIVEKAIEKDPDRRYQDLSQMRRDVERIKVEFAAAEPSTSATFVPPARHLQLEELGRRRAQQIAANLENAERAFELGDYGAALAACEDALIIDPHDGRAHEGLQRAQAALVERRALSHLNAARQHFEKDELSQAEAALHSAFELAPSLREGIDLQQALGSARQQKEQRSRSLKLALDRARIRFGEGAFESALHAADEALECDPRDSQAQRLKADALAALAQERSRRELDRRAHVAVEEATRLAVRDRYDEALQMLEASTIATHPLVRDALEHIGKARVEFEELKAAAARAEEACGETARLDAARREPASGALADGAIVPIAAPPAAVAVEDATVTLPIPALRSIQAELSDTALIDLHRSPGYLPGPLRKRRPQPPHRPVFFLDADAPGPGGPREWFGDQLFVGAKQGHDVVGFGVSLTTHVAIAAGVILVVLMQPVILQPPKTPTVVIAALAQQPVADVTPQKHTEPAKPRVDARRTPQLSAQVSPTETTPTPPAPVESLPMIPTSDSMTAIGAVTQVESGPVTNPGPPLTAAALGQSASIPVTDYDQNPVLITQVLPKVPVGASGVVRVEVTILNTGRVSRVRVINHTEYDAAIVAAAQECVFQPARRRGKPVTVTTEIVFKLETNK
jgi:TonB family protein